MFSIVLAQKWWMGMVAGVFGVLGVGTALVAMPAFADGGRSPNSATPGGVEVRLECKKGTWTEGSFNWTLAGKPVGSSVALKACPDGKRRTMTLPPVTMPGTGAGTTGVTGAATADGFRIRVSGKSDSGDTTAECTLPSPSLGAKDSRRRNATLTCSADGATSKRQAHMKIKVRWSDPADGDDCQGGPGRDQCPPDRGNQPRDPKPDDGKDKDKLNPTSSQDNGEKRGWQNPFSRGRGR